MEKEVLLSEQIFYDCNLPKEVEGYKLIELYDDIYRYEKINKNLLSLELNINYICKDTIKKRKAVYGNNFPQIAELESKYLGTKITPQQVAYKLAILKQVRIDFIKTKIEDLQNITFFSGYDYMRHFEIKQLRHALEDSLKDFSNYLWISENYEEYEAL